MWKIEFLGLLVVLLQSFSCAQAQKIRPPEEAACGASNAKLKVHLDNKQHPLGTTDADHALIYIIEEGGLMGNFTTRYGMDGNWIGDNHGMRSYFFRTIEAGDHRLCREWQSPTLFRGHPVSVLSFTAKGSVVYYFRAKVDHMSSPQTIDLQPINADEGTLLISTSAFSTTEP
jgi:hypothetical protein